MSDNENSTTAARTDRTRWLFVALLLVLFRALPNISYPIGWDQATYFVIGEGLLRGQRLYLELWDNKPPGIFAIYALLVKPFGHVMWSVGLVDILWLLAISYCIFRFVDRYLGTVAAAIAVVVNAAWHCANGYADAGQPECFLMLLVFAGYFLVVAEGRWRVARALLAGMCLGGAFWLKYNALAFLPLLAVFPYLDWSGFDFKPRRLRLLIPWRAWLARVAVLLAGLLMAVAAVLIYFRLTGSWASFREVQLEVLPRYATMAPKLIPHFWATAAARALLGVGWWTVLATGVSIFTAEDGALSRLLPILTAAAMGFAATASQFRFRPYAFETSFPFFAAIWGYLAVKVYEGLKGLAKQPDRRWTARLLAAAALTVIVAGPLRTEVIAITRRYRDLAWWRHDSAGFFADYPAERWAHENLGDQLQVIDSLRRLAVPGDALFVWGTSPLIYYLTGLRPPTRFVSNLALISRWGPKQWRDELVRDLEKSPPAFVVVERGDNAPEITFANLDSAQYLAIYPSLSDLISRSYTVAVEFRGFVVYRRKPPGRN